MKLWKVLGLAGLAGVAATGAIIVRSERQRQALTPQEVRERLHQRHAQVELAAVPPAAERTARSTGRLRSAARQALKSRNRPPQV